MFTIRFKSLLIISLVFFIGLVQAQTIRSDLTNKTPNSRYTVNDSNGTVTDKGTNLMWKKCPEGLSDSGCSTGTATTHNWQESLQIPATLNATTNGYAGFKDWRLPSITELLSLVAYDRFDPTINETIFPNTGVTFFWSSSPYAGDSGFAWHLSPSGTSNNDPFQRNTSFGVRLVRGGQ